MTANATRGEMVDGGLVSVGQAAEFLGLARSTVYLLMETGQLSYCKIRGARRIPRRCLTELAAKSLVTATA